MSHYQPGILATPVPLQARHLFFALASIEGLPQAIDNLLRLETAEDVAPVFDRLEGARALGGLPVSRLS